MTASVLILGASYGSLLGTKLLMAGHRVTLGCTRPTAGLINREGTVVRFPLRGRAEPVAIASRDLSPPRHVVAPAPFVWVPPPPGALSPSGFFFADGYRAPTNVVRASDGYYYSLFELYPTKFVDSGGLCVMRTDRLDDPASWRAWDGSGFNLRMTSPYVTGSAAPLCTFLGRIAYMGGGHVVNSTYLNRFVLVAPGGVQVDGRHVCGFIFSLSADGSNWAEPQLLAQAKSAYCLAVTPGPGAIETVPTLYPSLVHHTDTTVNYRRYTVAMIKSATVTAITCRARILY